LVVAKLRERLAVSKHTVEKMVVERFNLKELNKGKLKRVSGYNQLVCGSGKLRG
jgi:hypothetical protein